MYKIEYLPAAQNDLLEILKYIAVNLANKKAATEITKEIVAKIDGLAEFPYKNAVYNPIRPLNYEYRKLPVKNYLVFYRVDEDLKLITVVRLIYGRRNVNRILK